MLPSLTREASPRQEQPSLRLCPMRLAAWLAIVLVLSKGSCLERSREYWWVLNLSMVSFADVFFALSLGALGYLAMRATMIRNIAIAAAGQRAFVGICVLCAFYSVIAAGVFNYYGRPLSYDLLRLMHGVATVESSIRDRLSLPVVAALIVVPGGYYALTRNLARKRSAPMFLVAMLLAWSAFGCWSYYWRSDVWAIDVPNPAKPKFILRRNLSVNPHIELVRSTLKGWAGLGKPSLERDYPPEYQEEFKPRAQRRASAERAHHQLAAAGAQAKNVIVIVLESVGTQYLSLYGSSYNTTPRLVEEAAHAVVFENFYAHVPRTSFSFMALNFSIYPGMPWSYARIDAFKSDGTRRLPQTLASVLKQRGARTAYMHNGDLEWAGMRVLLENQGYDIIEDYRAMGGTTLTSYGTEDKVLFEHLIRFIDEKPGQPFYAFCWTDQTHHPHKLSPTSTRIDFFGQEVPAHHARELDNYLNVLHQVDQHLGELFRALRDRGLADETLVAITGDHGEAFRNPHDQLGHGFTAYQEDVNVPLIIWSPRLFSGGRRPETIGAHVDLSATIADLLGIQSPGDWQGHSLFDPARPQRAYYFASIGEYLFGVRDGKWKYTFEATSGREFLSDLTVDPDELENVANLQPGVCRELRRRVSAWVDFEDKFLRPNHN
ncbi:MAG: LTA synthase family protein [Terrimicrobiaceae bacterium]